MEEPKPIHIIFTSSGFMELQFLARFPYPATIAEASPELETKAWHVLRAFQMLNEELSNKPYIEKILSEHITDLTNAINSHPEKGPFLVWIQNYRISFATEALFFEIKAFLDFFATNIIAKALNMHSIPGTFKSKGSGADCDPGRRFLDALERNVSDEYKEKAAAIAAIIERHKPLWIDSVIKDRNKATHGGTLQTKITMNSGLLQAPLTDFTFQTLFETTDMVELSASVAKQFVQFLDEVLKEIIK